MLALVLSLGLIGCGNNEPDMVLVEAGTTTEDNGEITVEDDFYIGKYHVTQAEFEEVMGFNPSIFDGNSDHPVENVTWYDAVKYANELSEAEGLDKYYNISDIEYKGEDAEEYWEHPENIDDAEVEENEGANGYRLPTENEHEYAARGGKDGDATTYAGSDDLDEVGWYRDNSDEANSDRDDDRGTMPVGEKDANELGIYDMSGNVWDWTNTPDGSYRIALGGSWYNIADSCEVDFSDSDSPSSVYISLGFRLTKTQ
ncbi:MAG: formylglycine-generating enzyme family protein [Bacteroidales bacterium]